MILLKRVLWYKLKDRNTELVTDNTYQDPEDITDDVNWTSGKGLDIKNNVLTLTVKNAHGKYVTDGELQFSEQDQIKVYLKYTDDNDEVTSGWDADSSSYPDDSDLVSVFYVIEFASAHTNKGTKLKITCADKTYILFNRVFSKAYLISDAKTAAKQVQEIVQFSSQNQFGIYQGSGVNGTKYDIDARLFSENVFTAGTTTSATSSKLNDTNNSFTTVKIGDYVRNVTDDTYASVSAIDSNSILSLNRDIMATSEYYQISKGYIQDSRTDGTVFPSTAIAKVWKPIYEWINDLSQTEKTNSAAELAATTLVQKRPMIFWVDQNNKFHWVYADNTVTSTLTAGTNTNILSISIVKKVFDTVNMVIFNAGTDLYGRGIWNYEVDTTSSIRTLKMKVMPMTDIAETLYQKDYGPDFNPPASRDSGEGGKGPGLPIPQFPTTYALTVCAFVPTTTYANAAAIDGDAKYNGALRERATDEGKSRARAILSVLANARWKGTIEVTGSLTYQPGDLLNVTDSEIGINAEKLRLMQVQHNITKSGWFTTLSLEEDSEEQ